MPSIIRAKLATNARKELPVEVPFTVVAWLQVIQAELVSAITACHMIAALVFVACDSALRAIDRSGLFFPLLEVFVLLGFTALTVLMSSLSTGEAHLFATLLAGHKLISFLLLRFSNVAFASRYGTPSKVGVQVDHRIRLEAFVLVDVSLVDTVSDIILVKCLSAAPLHAANAHNFALVDLVDEIVLKAKHTELVLAVETVKLIFRVFLVAKVTSAL